MKVCGKCSRPLNDANKSFCDFDCLVTSQEFLDSSHATRGTRNAKRSGPHRTGQIVECLGCGISFYAKPSELARGKKTCSRLCYRKYMSERFDRHVDTVATLKKITGYDEFLSQQVLHCLVEGCNWTGHSLSGHMNQSQGITARKFKKMAGFNLSTGVVSAHMQTNLKDRGNKGGMVNNAIAIKARRFDYKSAEGKEHYLKGMVLRNLKKT